MKKLLISLAFIGFSTAAHAVTPVIKDVNGTVSTGQTLTIGGSNMVQENSGSWLPMFKSGTAFGFEGSSPSADGYWALHSGGSYDSTVKLSGNKSMKFHVGGACSTVSSNLADYAGISGVSDMYARAYIRYYSPPGQWFKMQDKTFHAWFNPQQYVFEIANTPDGSRPSSFQAEWDDASHYANIPGGVLQDNRWYYVELHWKSGSPNVYQVWVDGVQIFNANPKAFSPGYFLFGIVNMCGTSSGFTHDRWFDGFALSTARIYPSSTIEVSNNSTYGAGTVKYQEPIYLSDGSVQIKLDLTGLGTGPYYLWVTNNNQERSAVFNLAAAVPGGVVTAPAPAPAPVPVPAPAPIPEPPPAAASVAGTLLLQENFADGNIAARGWYDNTNLVLSTAEHIPGSASSAAFVFNAGATTPTSGGAMRKQFAESDSIYISYWVKYSSNWREQPGSTSGHHEILLTTNMDDVYTNLSFNRLTAYLETWGTSGQNVPVTPNISFQDGANIDQAKINVNLVNVTENRATCGCNGVSDPYLFECYDAGGGVYRNTKFIPGVNNSITLGTWHHVEAYIKLNSIVNSKGVADGIVNYWLDGVPQLQLSNVIMRTNANPKMKFNQFVFAPYMWNGAPASQTFWIDDLTVATARAGGALIPPANLRIKTN